MADRRAIDRRERVGLITKPAWLKARLLAAERAGAENSFNIVLIHKDSQVLSSCDIGSSSQQFLIYCIHILRLLLGRTINWLMLNLLSFTHTFMSS